MGDANGVGPEILLRTFLKGLLPSETIVSGDYSVLKKCNQTLKLEVPFNLVDNSSNLKENALNISDAGCLKDEEITPGKINRKAGRAALLYLDKVARMAQRKEVEAIVTLPVNKEAIRLTEPDFSGHTGHLARLSGIGNYTMMLVSRRLIVTHVSTHVSLREALERVKKKRIVDVIRLTHAALKKLRPRARIAVAGLNPHAGENGAFGREEIEEIAPAVSEARREGIDISGPIAPDIIFHLAASGHFDAVVCMYHDQGHIPLKLLDFEEGVNITLGLPFVRTSVDHGTAFDIAWKGEASIASFVNACGLATQLTGK